MTAVLLGLMGGLTVGVCAAPLWMMLQLPMRLTDILGIKFGYVRYIEPRNKRK